MTGLSPYRVVGRVTAVALGGPLVLPPQEAITLAALLATRGGELDRDTLTDLLYLRTVPPDPPDPLADKVFQLGRRLRAAGLPWEVRRRPFHWALDLPLTAVDADHLVVRLDAADVLERDGHPAHEVRESLAGALGLVLDRPYDALVHPWFEPFRTEVAARQVRLLVRFATADRALGDPAGTAPLLEAAVDRPHLRGHRDLWEALVLAHVAVGRVGDALGVLDRGRTTLLDLGRTADAHWLGGLRRRVAAGDPTLVLRATGLRTAPVPGGAPLRTPRVAPAAPVPPPPVLAWSLFGRTVVRRDDEPAALDGPTARLLAALLVHRNTPVRAADVAGVVRPDRPAADPDADVRELVARLRDRWSPHRLPVEETAGTTWTLRTEPGAVDLDVARALEAKAAAAGDPRTAARHLREALASVPGDPLDTLPGPWFAAERARLETWRESLVFACVHADVGIGVPERALPDLRALVRRYPLREDLWEWLIVATARRDGRDAALAVYAEAVEAIESRLRTGPGPSLRMLRARIEAGDPALRQP